MIKRPDQKSELRTSIQISFHKSTVVGLEILTKQSKPNYLEVYYILTILAGVKNSEAVNLVT